MLTPVTAFLNELTAPEYKGQVIIHYDGGDEGVPLWPRTLTVQRHMTAAGPHSKHNEAETRKPSDKPLKVELAHT